ncbi:hypothetical protein H1R20_g3875, partial [Candolleomyces eurysporus]
MTTDVTRPPSEMEAKYYYYGLPSRPILVARTGTTEWKEPTGPDAYLDRKELRVVGAHPLKEIWDDFVKELHALLDRMHVRWTSTDLVRIGQTSKSCSGGCAPLIVWIGVQPRSLTPLDGVSVATQVKELLCRNNIGDVDCEIRESVVYRAGFSLVKPASASDTVTADIRIPLTATVGIPICAQDVPGAEGSAGFFLKDKASGKLLLCTARHVLFGTNSLESNNHHFEAADPSQPRRNVTVLSNSYLEKFLNRLEKKLFFQETFSLPYQQKKLDWLVNEMPNGSPNVERSREVCQMDLKNIHDGVPWLKGLKKVILGWWSNKPENRILGSVFLSPPISLHNEEGKFTEDWAVVELNPEMVNATNFFGNVVDLRIGPSSEGIVTYPRDIVYKMSPNPKKPTGFEYPRNHLLKISGVVPLSELRNPQTVDENNAPCLFVLKRGMGSNLTMGKSNDAMSYTRTYFEDPQLAPQVSREWAILPYDLDTIDTSGESFSSVGDSGSAIVDGTGRIGGILTGGTARADSDTNRLDITYGTPASFLHDTFRKHGIDADFDVDTFFSEGSPLPAGNSTCS